MITSGARRVREALGRVIVGQNEAIDLATELEMRALFARCNFELGQLWLRKGDPTAAAEYLSKAGAMLREMDIRWGVEKVEADLQSLG